MISRARRAHRSEPVSNTAPGNPDDVITAALSGLRQAFKLDVLLLVTSTTAGGHRTWSDRRHDIDAEAPELTISRTELQKLFDSPRQSARWGHYRWLRGRYLWLRGPLNDVGSRGRADNFGLAAARRTRLSPVESTLLSDLCRALVSFRTGFDDHRIDRAEMAAKTTVRTRKESGLVVAEVHATWALPAADGSDLLGSPPRRAGLGRGHDTIGAVARAAAKAARPRCEIIHAGVVAVPAPAHTVGVVQRAVAVVRRPGGEVRIALAEGSATAERPDLHAVALAVLLASHPAGGPVPAVRGKSGIEIDLTPTQIGQKLR